MYVCVCVLHLLIFLVKYPGKKKNNRLNFIMSHLEDVAKNLSDNFQGLESFLKDLILLRPLKLDFES